MTVTAHDIPRHVAIIMDGNGRWAKSRNLPRFRGHIEGVKRVEDIIDSSRDLGIKALTLFTFSTENWQRPAAEVAMLMKTLCSVLDDRVKKLQDINVRFNFIGRREGVPSDVLKTIDSSRQLTAHCTGMILNMAFNYGARLEIVDAIKAISRKVRDGDLDIDSIDENTVSQNLYTADLPDPDLLIRTSGEQRISNFLLWQLSYAEFYFTDKFWPDFTKEEFSRAISVFRSRERRFGKI